MASFPSDCAVSKDDILSELDEHLIYRIKKFKPMKNGCSLDTYIFSCKDWIKNDAYKSLIKEYVRAKNQLTIDELRKTDDGEKVTKHISPKCLTDTHCDGYEAVENKIDKSLLCRKMTLVYETAMKMDKETEMAYDYAHIIDLKKQGISMQEIADELGTNKMDISRRLNSVRERIAKEKTKWN